MIVITKNLMINRVKEEDLKDILEVYNSNESFLLAHMDRSKVSMEWVIKEQEEMQRANFQTLIVKEKKQGLVIGFIDIFMKEESYLSLLMLHSNYKGKGYGNEVYQALETYLKKRGSKRIRIDVVSNYNRAVLQFWQHRGFNKVKEIQLRWVNKELDAFVMKKNLV